MMDSPGATPYITGDLIDRRYRIEDVRRGAMGIVYLCMDTTDQKPVAIKTFEERYLDSIENRKCFIDESMMWILLDNHPNIVRAYFIKLINKKPYLFLERIIADNPRGVTLKDFLFTNVVPSRDMIQFAIHICNGMIHAISKFPHLVHRDLKSENILIGRDRIPKISDFGMTMRLEQISQDDISTSALRPSDFASRMEGTPTFASPEQCLCQPLDTRSDIYSFGCILYNMATKRLPFQYNTVEEIIVAHQKERPIPPLQIDSRNLPLYSHFILKCLEKDPYDRFLSFEDAREELIQLYKLTFGESPRSFNKSSPLTFSEYVERAWSFAYLEHYSLARKELEKAHKVEPNRHEIILQHAKLFLHQEHYKKALDCLNRAKNLIPENAEMYELQGMAHAALNHYTEAENCLRIAIRSEHDRVSAYRELSRVLLKRKKAESAQEILKNGLLCCEDKTLLYTALGEVYRQTGDYKNERDVLMKTVDEAQSDMDLLIQLIEVNFHLNDQRSALRWAQQIEEEHPDSFEVWYKLGTIYQKTKNLLPAANAWKQAEETGEGDGSFYADYAELCYQLREYDKAWQYVLKAEERGVEIEAVKRKIQARRLSSRKW